MNYSRVTHQEENWLVKSILEYIDMFYDSNSVRSFSSESTLFDEMYSFIKQSKKLCGTFTEFTAGSLASNESKNEKRELGTVNRISRQVPGDVPGLAFLYMNNEIGCVEIGLLDKGINGTKTINEREFKSPKMMRNYCWKIVNDYKFDPAKIKIVCYVISGSYFSSSIMTFEYGSVAPVCSSARMKMPTTIKEIPRLLPRALKLCFNVSKVMKSTINYLDDICEVEYDCTECYFPPSFESAPPFGETISNKKRKSPE